METCLKGIAEHFPLTEKELRGYSSLGLAYIGDCIFELFVRTMVVTKGNDKANHYHQKTINTLLLMSTILYVLYLDYLHPLLTSQPFQFFFTFCRQVVFVFNIIKTRYYSVIHRNLKIFVLR